jgi:hypothetical protein
MILDKGFANYEELPQKRRKDFRTDHLLETKEEDNKDTFIGSESVPLFPGGSIEDLLPEKHGQ